MRNWGIVITGFYAVVVIFLFTYGIVLLGAPDTIDFKGPGDFLEDPYMALIPILIIVSAQVLLLFLSVDSSWRRMKPQRHVMVTVSLVGFMLTILAVAIVFAIGVAYSGEDFQLITWLENSPENLQFSVSLAAVALIWASWTAVFYTFSKRASSIVDSAVNWLIKGSVLELLIVVPSHIIVRQRDECSAPFYSAYGIATGIAIMLMAFGPGILFLYRRKFGDYK